MQKVLRASFIYCAFVPGVFCLSQTTTAGAAQHAASLAEGGHCAEALPLLLKGEHTTDKQLQKRIGLAGVRCATVLQQQDALFDFLRMLSRQFPHDPEVLYVLTHAFSDLASRDAQELARTAPTSIPALEMDADASETQGKWDQAEKDYRKILEESPKYPGIHFRLARMLLSRPNPAPDFAEQAKKELQAELAIDPSNAGAEYVLGELARQGTDLPTAVQHFTRATQLEPNFADAWLGLGMTLLAQKQYGDAVVPLEKAVKLQPANPASHYSLATAYSRTGRKEEAQREFALQQQTAGPPPNDPAAQNQSGPRARSDPAALTPSLSPQSEWRRCLPSACFRGAA